MQIERIRPTILQVTLHAYELSALIAGARWIVDGAEGELTEDARKQLRAVLKSYREEVNRIDSE